MNPPKPVNTATMITSRRTGQIWFRFTKLTLRPAKILSRKNHPAAARPGVTVARVGRAVLCPPPSANERVLIHHDGAHEPRHRMSGGVTRPTFAPACLGLRREAQRHAAFARTTRMEVSKRLVRPKAVSPLRSATALQNAVRDSFACIGGWIQPLFARVHAMVASKR